MSNFNNQLNEWESAFANYVKGLDTKNIQLIDQSLATMKTIDNELATTIWNEDMVTVRQWRVMDNQLAQLHTEGYTRYKTREQANAFIAYVNELGVNVKVKSQWGKYFTVELK